MEASEHSAKHKNNNNGNLSLRKESACLIYLKETKDKDKKTLLLQVDSNTKMTINRASVSNLAGKNDSQNEQIEEN